MKLFRPQGRPAGRGCRQVGGEPVDNRGSGEKFLKLAARVLAPFGVKREQSFERGTGRFALARRTGRERARQKPELKRVAGELPGMERRRSPITAQVAAEEQKE